MNGYEEYLYEQVIASAAASMGSAILGSLVSIAVYIMQAIALWRMAEKLGIPNGWLAFIPIANVWLLGKIADAGERSPKHAKRLLVMEILTVVLTFLVCGFLVAATVSGWEGYTFIMGLLSVALIILAIVYTVFSYIACFRICEDFAPENAVGWFLGILLGGLCCSSLIPPILMLILSGKEPASGAPKATYTEVPPRDDVF